MSPFQFKLFLIAKLPIAWLAGLRLVSISDIQSSISVRLSWLSQNPFQSMFWAVQGMAAEMSTGVLCLTKIQKSNQAISMLVIEQKAQFFKKAKGNIVFTCRQGEQINQVLDLAIQSQSGQTLTLVSEGIDEAGDIVSRFEFLWSFKVK